MNKECIKRIDVVRNEDGRIHVLGSGNSGNFWNPTRLYHIIHDESTGNVIEEEYYDRGHVDDIPLGLSLLKKSWREGANKVKRYFNKVRQFEDENTNDIRKAAGRIKIYLGGIEEAEKDFGREMKICIENGNPERFIDGLAHQFRLDDCDSELGLRVRALELRAVAIANYQHKSSVSSGTPVRYIDKK